jgi:hypothetical protein
MRQVFDTLEELLNYIRTNPQAVRKKIPYEVGIDGQTRFTLAGNSDAAIAAVARDNGAFVESIPISALMKW